MENDCLQRASFHQDLLTRNHEERRFDINVSKQPNLPYIEGKFERWFQVVFFCFFVSFLSFWKRSRWLDSKCPRAWSSHSIGRLPLGGWQATLNTLPNEVAAEWLTLTHFWLILSGAWGSVRRGRNSQPNTAEATRFLESWNSFPARLLCSPAAPGELWDASASDELEFIDAAFCYSTAAASINLWPTAKIVTDNREMTGKEAGWFHWRHFLNTSSRFAHKNEGKPEAAERTKKKECIHIHNIYIYVCVLADASSWESPCTEWLTWIKWLHKVDLFVSISAAVRLWQPRSKAALREINLPMPSGIPERAGWPRPPIAADRLLEPWKQQEPWRQWNFPL